VTDRTPSFDDLVDPDLPEGERDRLRSVHELLLRAGAPPELPPLREPAEARKARVIQFPRRYRYTLLASAAAAALVLFGAGYAIGNRDAPDAPVQTIAMTGVGGATGSIELMANDAAGNWPMILHVRGLPSLPPGKTYTLWLTRGHKLIEPCGTFVTDGSADVPLNAPYRLRTFDGWVVVRTGAKTPRLWTV
jgi:hypothetical protein